MGATASQGPRKALDTFKSRVVVNLWNRHRIDLGDPSGLRTDVAYLLGRLYELGFTAPDAADTVAYSLPKKPN